jgi:uncharacterized protein (DUF2235 family)
MKKRLIVCCDGTWNWPDQKGNPTNVVKMTRAILPVAADGTVQTVFYDAGVGTGNLLDRLGGGMLGMGLADNVKQAYASLALNYAPGDEVFFFGFSRGAFTVRSLGGLIGLVGILDKRHMDKFHYAWDYYRTPPPRRTSQQRAEFLARFGDAPPQKMRIDFIGVWDTVGALGIPFGPLRFVGKRKFQFHNTNLGDNVAHAYQALAIDERRRVFAPAVWKREANLEERLRAYGIHEQVIEQSWLSGAHSNVGGGYPDTGLSDLAFVWMARKAQLCGLALDEEYVQQKQAGTHYLLVNSRTLRWRLLPGKERELCNTDASEHVHATALMRLHGKDGDYEPFPYESPGLERLIRRAGAVFDKLVDRT